MMKTVDEQLKTVLQFVEAQRLGQGLTALENYLLTYSFPQEQERLTRIQEDYRRMMDYWQRGFQDDQREVVYKQLLRRLYRLAADLIITIRLNQSPFAMDSVRRAQSSREDWSLTAIRNDLESFVSNQALLDLKPHHTREVAEGELYDRHQTIIKNVFDNLWLSPTWSESMGEAFLNLLLSPTIDSIDQQVMTSAIMLSVLNQFDYQKWRVLMEVYRRTADEHVRQRALVGWVLALDDHYAGIYPEMSSTLQELLADPKSRQELLELQMQLVYSMSAEEDSNKAQKEMFSEIMKNNDQFRITRNGIEEVEEDSLEDILHPEASEQRIEKLEAAISQMVDMQRSGADIYFAGFVQMKRFPFFNDTCNWFMPFYAKHPALRQTMNDERRGCVLQGMIHRSPFCDSDSYSFAFGFMESLKHLPKKLLTLLDSGELSVLGDVMDNEAKEEPAFVRRAYLQDVFRFYRLFPSRNVFVSPFEKMADNSRVFFFSKTLFGKTPLVNDFVEVAAFLTKKQLYDEACKVLANCPDSMYNEQYYLLSAAVMKHQKTSASMHETIMQCYQNVLKMNPKHEGALKGLARELFTKGDYQYALDIYEQLLTLKPDLSHYLLNKAVCLGRVYRYEEALEILFKMSYEQPESQVISSTLAWTLVGAGKLEQAAKYYNQLMQQPETAPNNLLNSGLCQWLMGNVSAAAELFRRYIACGKNGQEKELSFQEEADLLRRHNISDVEIRLMMDLVRA